MIAALFPQDRVGFLSGLALWSAACGFVGALLRNFAAYGAGLAGFTAAVIASDVFGPTGGANDQVFLLALIRVVEITVGIVSAGVVLALTDLGGARRLLGGESRPSPPTRCRASRPPCRRPTPWSRRPARCGARSCGGRSRSIR